MSLLNLQNKIRSIKDVKVEGNILYVFQQCENWTKIYK